MKRNYKEYYHLLLLTAFILLSYNIQAQKTVGIGGAMDELNTNAVLHLMAPAGDQGFLVPSITTPQRTASSFTTKLSSDDNGLLVYDKDEKKFYYWKDNAWIALIGTDVGVILTAGLGININGNAQIENTGDIDSTDDITIGTTAGGDLSGTYPNPVVNDNAITRQKIANDAVDREKIAANVAGSGLNQNVDGSLEINPGAGLEINADALQLTNTGVTSGTFGTINMVPQFIVDETGRISSITELPITVSPSGVAGGELSGTYPNPTIKEDVIDSSNIKMGAIITENLADEAVTSEKLASLSVDISKLNPGPNNENSIVYTNSSNDLVWLKPGNSQVLVTSSDGQIRSENRSNFTTNTLNNGRIFIGNASNQAQEQIISGDVTMTLAGEVTIQPNAITSAEITDGSIGTNDMANSSITEQKLADEAVTLSKLANGTGNQVLTTDGSGNPQYEDKSAVFGVLAGEGLAENSGILDVQVDDATLEIDADIVRVKNSGIITDKIANTAVTEGKLADNAVTTNKVATNSITLSKLQDGTANQLLSTDGSGNPQYEDKSAVFSALAGEGLAENSGALDVQVDDVTLEIDANIIRVKNSGIITDKIANSAVTEGKLAENAVTMDKIASNNVTLGKLVDGGPNQVLTTDGSGNPQYEDKTIFVNSALSSGQIFIGNGSNVATAQTISGDATLANDGTLTLKNTGPGGTLGGGGNFIESISLDAQGRVTNAVAGPPPSDERLKTNIDPLGNVLAQLLQLNGYRYHWKSDSLQTKQDIGVIAQEVEQFFPELVRERSDGYKGVNYNGLVALLLEALKEQQNTIQQLSEENESIKSDIISIKAALGLDR